MLALTKAHSIPAQKLMFEFGQFFLWYLADHAGIGKVRKLVHSCNRCRRCSNVCHAPLR